jgi:hypothetical protein
MSSYWKFLLEAIIYDSSISRTAYVRFLQRTLSCTKDRFMVVLRGEANLLSYNSGKWFGLPGFRSGFLSSSQLFCLAPINKQEKLVLVKHLRGEVTTLKISIIYAIQWRNFTMNELESHESYPYIQVSAILKWPDVCRRSVLRLDTLVM